MSPAAGSRQHWRMICLGAWIAVLAQSSVLRAGPINTDVALTPHKGGSIFRLQYSYSEADRHDQVQQVSTSSVRGTYVFGLKQNLALFLSVPYPGLFTNLLRVA